jgi:hypothetical protein
MSTRGPLLALLLAGCSSPCRGPSTSDSGLAGSFDGCDGLVGAAAEVDLLELDLGWDRQCGTERVTVFTSEEQLEQLWPGQTDDVLAEVDFAAHQLLCLSHRSGCAAGLVIADIGWSATEPVTLLAQLRVDCAEPCDCPGGVDTQLWRTPIAPVAECRFGNGCDR